MAANLTPLELEIMKVLWRDGASNVQAVRDRLAGEGRDLAYNSVQTMLIVLLRKGRVRRKRVGRAFEYAPRVGRAQAARQAIADLVERMFDGSSESLVLSLIDAKRMTPSRLAAIASELEEHRAGEP
ncbi:MAG: BlaI/MecI/CopY family transcriptional regulator [Thermoanaerobaculia bacterium]